MNRKIISAICFLLFVLLVNGQSGTGENQPGVTPSSATNGTSMTMMDLLSATSAPPVVTTPATAGGGVQATPSPPPVTPPGQTTPSPK